MHAAKALSILALAGSAVALPGWGNWGNYWSGNGGNNWNQNQNNAPADNNAAVVTMYTTVTYGGQWSKPTAAPTAPAATYTKPAAQATGSPAPSTGGSSDGYMGTVNEWRGKLGLSSLSEDSKLQGNALKTAQDGNGQMVHQLNPGSMAQVLAPGSPDEFVKVFVGGWLCELPNMPGMDGICDSMSAGWAYGGQTGHADILKSSSYSKIGCACATGIWSCDLA